jgi:PAS domain S-box-containing protein
MRSSVNESQRPAASSVTAENPMEAILEGIGDGFFALDEDWRFTYFNSTSEHFFRCARADVLGQVMWDRFPVLLGTEFERRYRRAMATRSKEDFEVPSAVMPGHILEVRAFPVHHGLGISFRDVTERRRAAVALRESEARFRHMADSVPALIWMTDTNGQVTFTNMHFGHVFNREPGELVGSRWEELIFEEDLRRFRAEFLRAFRAHQAFETEVRVTDKHGELRWLRCEGVSRLNDAGDFLGYTGCAVDVTDVKSIHDRQRLLTSELNHRVKNTLATVQSIAAQTLRNAHVDVAVRTSLEHRLLALARTHDVLTRESWEGAQLAELVAGAIAPYRHEKERHFQVSGPEVKLPPRAVLAMSMALQELATNAVKYGALSNEIGRINIAWTLSRSGSPVRIHLRWEELGGPLVTEPTRRGFGSRLIEKHLAQDLNGRVELEFAPAGLICDIDFSIGG